MNEKIIIEKNIRSYFDKNDNKKVVILPLRNLSGIVSDILKDEYGIKEQFLIDNYTYDMKNIYPMDRMPEGYGDCSFFIAAFGDTKKVLREQLLKYVAEDQIVDLLYDEEREQIFRSDCKVHLDFLCPGFAKCGTTSLHYALAQNSNIFLPQVKETQFLSYSVNQTAHEAFLSHYKKEDTEEKIVGGIEPSYVQHAEAVYRYFGKDLKLIFWVRNPIGTLYSNFKMAYRNEMVMLESDPMELDMMEGFEHVCPEMFEKYAIKNRYRKLYAGYIKEFLKYYPMEQIKIIVSEELYKDINTQMNEIQTFLGIGEGERLSYKEFPREHVGNKVAKDSLCLGINIRIKQLNHSLVHKGDFQSLALLKDIREKVEQITLVDYDEPMLESTRKDLQEYYRDSIHELESMIGRSLQGIWY